MTPLEVRREIERVANVLIDSGLAIDINLPVLRRDGPDVVVTWPASGDSFSTSGAQFGSIQEYRQIVLNRQYTCALNDGSLVQISVTFRNARLLKNRLCYYPCPIAFEAGSWNPAEIALLDLFDDVLVEEFDDVLESMGSVSVVGGSRLRMRGPIRFDYAPDQPAAVSHPGSHVHIGGENSRLPVFGPLSVGHFMRFVIRHYYPEYWLRDTVFREWPQVPGQRCITADEEEGLFFECRARIPTG